MENSLNFISRFLYEPWIIDWPILGCQINWLFLSTINIKIYALLIFVKVIHLNGLCFMDYVISHQGLKICDLVIWKSLVLNHHLLWKPSLITLCMFHCKKYRKQKMYPLVIKYYCRWMLFHILLNLLVTGTFFSIGMICITYISWWHHMWLTHWGWDRMAPILQTFSNSFLAATKQLYEWSCPSICLPAVQSLSQYSSHCIIMKF